MSRRPASLFVLLTLLAALWQPLCLCRGAQATARETGTSCCAPEETAPDPSAPCEEHGGDCECGRNVRLVPAENAGQVHLPLAFVFELPACLVEPAHAPRVPHAALRVVRSPAPPGRTGVLPLRI